MHTKPALPRWWELVPEGVLALGLGFFLVTETDAATSAFESTRAIVLMVVTAVAWLALRVGLAWLPRRWAVLRTSGFALGALGVLLVVVVPAYDDTTVVETLAADTDQTAATDQTAETEQTAPTSETVPSASTTTVPPEPVVLATGELHGIDHRASGTVRIYEQPTGALVVGLEEIDIQPGPDYDVYVVPGADREDIDGGTRLDDLRGNKGTQYYDVPGDLELTVTSPGWTVLVWCQTFDVPVAGSTPV